MRLFRNTTDLVLLSAFMVLSLLLIFGATAGVMTNRQRAMEQERVVAQNIASILGGNIEQRLNVFSGALDALATAISPDGNFSRDQLLGARPALQSRLTTLDDIYGLYVVDENGMLIASSLRDIDTPIDYSDRLNYALQNSPPGRPFVLGQPHEAQVPQFQGQWVVTVSRLLYAKDGALRGMVAGAVSVEALEKTIERMTVDGDTTVQLLTSDAELALQHPRAGATIGTPMPDARHLPTDDHGAQAMQWGARTRLVGWQRLPENRGYVVVSTPVESVLAADPWNSATVAMLTAAVIGLLAMLLLGLRRFLAERQRAGDELISVLSNVSDGVFALDAFNRFVFANREAERMLHGELPAMRGRSLTEALPNRETAQSLATRIDEARQAGRPMVWRLSDETAEAWYDVRIYPGRDRTVTVYVRDVSDDVAREERMRQTQKLETIGQLTGGVAHDFNNILTIIILNLELMQGTVSDGAMRALKAALSAAERGATLTDRLLAFARKQPLKPAAQDVRQVLADCETLLRPGLGDLYGLKVVVADSIPAVLADRNQLTNALVNLILNARDAMPAGGRIVVEATQRSVAIAEPEGGAGSGRVPTAGTYVVLSVSDDGIGMSPEVVARAFEPFFTTKPVGKGTGLGLSMVWGFARQSGGHAEIYSEIGSGTVVKLLLPAARSAEEEERQRLAAVPAGVGAAGGGGAAGQPPANVAKPRHILLVEDDSELRSIALDRLRAQGHTVLAAQDAVMAEDQLARLPADRRIDILVTDVVLPGGVTGPALAERLQQRFGRLQVLYTSGYTATVLNQRGILPEGSILLNKPYTAGDLAQAIAQVGMAHDMLQELSA